MTLTVKFLHQQPLSEVLHWLRGMVPDSQFLLQNKGYTIAHYLREEFQKD